MEQRNLKDLIGGALFAAVGVYFLWGGLGLRFGEAARMGPGYVPVLLSIILIALSCVTLFRAFRPSEPVYIRIAWRPVLAVAGGVVAFGLGFWKLGLIPAICASVLVAALGDPRSRLFSAILVAAFLAISSWLIFRVGLGLSMPAFRGF